MTLRPSFFRLLSTLVLLSLGACGAATDNVDLEIVFGDDSLRDRALEVDIDITAGNCDSEGAMEYSQTVREGDPLPPVNLEPGTYCFRVTARDGMCSYFAGAAVTVELPESDGAKITVTLEALGTETSACSLTEMCVSGACVPLVVDGPDGGDGGLDAGDSGIVADACASQIEICNGLDDNCNDAIDEGFTLATDRFNCGACDVVCESGEECVSGDCVVLCPVANTGNCDGMAVNGCEADLMSTDAHCGACDRSCGTGIACVNGTCEDEVVDLAAGDGFTCAVFHYGEMACWGRNDDGALGNNTLVTSAVPVRVSGIASAAQVGAGSRHACVRLDSGAVRCWGRGREGQLGDSSGENRRTPVPTGISNASFVSAGGADSCATLRTGVVKCWGDNSSGQLGTGDQVKQDSPVQVAGLTGVDATATGGLHSCALRRTGEVVCWGDNRCNQIGDGMDSDERAMQLTPGTSVVGLTATGIAAGGSPDPAAGMGRCAYGHTCATLADNTIQCWGGGGQGQLGNLTLSDSEFPVGVVISAGTPLTDGVQVTGGLEHTCTIRQSGSVACWGRNADAQLGAGDTVSPRSSPVMVMDLGGASIAAAGANHSCAVTSRGGVQCWGDNGTDQLGDGAADTAESMVPREVAGLRGAVQLDAGDRHTCVRRFNGQVLCWGDNGSKALGNPAVGAESLVPVLVDGLNDAIDLSVGEDHSCAVRANGRVVCWGDNTGGKLGDDSEVDRATPVEAVGITSAVRVSAGGTHSCAVLANGTIECWGTNNDGQIGDGSTIPHKTPVPVTLTGVLEVAAGDRHTCARTSTNVTYCWGRNVSGQVGDGTLLRQTSPVLVTPSFGATQVDTGEAISCALRTDRTVRCWGTNTNGLLGRGGTAGIPPSANTADSGVIGLGDARQISVGNQHVCAVRTNGAVRCWGFNGTFQLGDGMTATTATPVDVEMLEPVVSVAAGLDHTCARHASGSVSCWGRNSSGQLGDNTKTLRMSPISTNGLP